MFITCSSLTAMCVCFSCRRRLPLSSCSFPLLFSAELLLVNAFIHLLLSAKEVKKKKLKKEQEEEKLHFWHCVCVAEERNIINCQVI